MVNQIGNAFASGINVSQREVSLGGWADVYNRRVYASREPWGSKARERCGALGSLLRWRLLSSDNSSVL